MKDKLSVPDPCTSLPAEDKLKCGQWYWMKGKDGPWLACVTHIGSNYAEVTAVHEGYTRVSLDEWEESIDHQELDPDSVINREVSEHQERVRWLLGEVQKITAGLGLQPMAALPSPEGVSTALAVVHGQQDVKAHKEALILAKEKTLPDLFKKIEEEHKSMAMWMKAKLVPMKSDLKAMKKLTEGIEGKIFTVELYAGLCEELALVREGAPTGNDEKIHLFQRRHYMDEECLVNYQAGGMTFEDIRAFDRWLSRKANFYRILPYPKCAVAFRVRREDRTPEYVSLSEFIRMGFQGNEDKRTFLYLRNGEQCYRLDTSIDFGPQLFPDPEHSHLISGQLYVEGSWGRFITEQQYQEHQENLRRRRERHESELAAWEKMTKEERKGRSKPWYSESSWDRYELLTPKHLQYDDVMEKLSAEVLAHNRIAVVLQGLLDRSPAFHPHPPWRIWTPEGFASGVVLAYDETKGLTDGPAPDFEAYRQRLNATIAVGTNVVGQEIAWLKYEAEKENKRQEGDYRLRDRTHYNRFRPYGNPGPGTVAKVHRMSRDKAQCSFAWGRDRNRPGWVPNPERPGWMKRDDSQINVRFTCPTSELLNVDAYAPGDFRQFYRDPRTRAQYIVWAPLLLAAEDFHKKRGNS